PERDALVAARRCHPIRRSHRAGGPMSDLAPHRIAASFDSATALHAAAVAALNGKPFSHLGSSSLAAAGVRMAGRLPWSLLRHGYAAAGAAEALPARRLGDVDMATVAEWLAGSVPDRTYPAVLIGSSNGALTHLAAAL